MSERHHPSQSRLVWPPSPGFFKVKMVRRGWAVPAVISCDPAGLWIGELDGVLGLADRDPVMADFIAMIWQGGAMIDRAEYAWLTAVREAADRDHPSRNPYRPINPALLRPVMP